MAFPNLPNFNFNGSNPLADAVQEFKGELSASGYLDMTIGDAATIAGEEFAERIGMDYDELAALAGGVIGGAPELEFPKGILKYGNYMCLDIFEERIFEAGVGVKDRSVDSKLLTIKLPLPSQLATSYSQGYKQEGIGVLGASAGVEVANEIKKATQGGTTLEGLKAAGTKVKDNVGGEGIAAVGASAAPDVGAAVGAKMGGIPGAVVGDQLAKTVTGSFGAAGIARNPHMAVLYEAPNFRTFQFSWDLRPKNAKESELIKKIIKQLKYYSHPSKTEKEHFFNYPEQFGIRFKKDDFLFKTRRCVCTNVQTDYHGEGTPLYYDHQGRKKAPAVYKLDLAFTETKILTKKDIQEGM